MTSRQRARERGGRARRARRRSGAASWWRAKSRLEQRARSGGGAAPRRRRARAPRCATASYQRSIQSSSTAIRWRCELGGARVGRPRGLGARAPRSAPSSAATLAGRHGDRAPAPAGQQPARGGAPLGAAADISSPKRTTAPRRSLGRDSNTCTWPRPITVSVRGSTGDGRAVDPVLRLPPSRTQTARGSRAGAARARARRRSRARRAQPPRPGSRAGRDRAWIYRSSWMARCRGTARGPVDPRSARAHPTAAATAAANASTSSARVSCAHIQRTSPVCSSQV